MSYTVKQISKLSGVSARTLHFYDEIGLLKPARYGENGYRYYEQEQLLLLQQILFYRELGFPLNEIQEIVTRKDFDKLTALQSHRKILEGNVQHAKNLIATIDKTIAHLKGEIEMKDGEIYEGFDPAKQAEYETYLIDRGGEKTRALIEESKKRLKSFKKEDYADVKREFDEIHRNLTEALQKKLAPGSTEVQTMIQRHHTLINRFYTPTAEMYAGLGRLYSEHEDFKKLYDSHHPKLAEFMEAAMRHFVGE